MLVSVYLINTLYFAFFRSWIVADTCGSAVHYGNCHRYHHYHHNSRAIASVVLLVKMRALWCPTRQSCPQWYWTSDNGDIEPPENAMADVAIPFHNPHRWHVPLASALVPWVAKRYCPPRPSTSASCVLAFPPSCDRPDNDYLGRPIGKNNPNEWLGTIATESDAWHSKQELWIVAATSA